MACAACTKAGVDHDDIVAKCKSSLFWAAYYLCEWHDMSFELHMALCNWMENRLDSGKRRFLVMIPRGHFKSSVFSVALCVWQLIRNPELRILFVMSSAPLAEDKLGQIHEIFRRGPMRHFFPELIPEKNVHKSTAREIEIPRIHNAGEPSVRALGASTKVTGGHYDIIIGDDLIDGLAEESELQMRQALKWLERSNPLFHNRATGVRIVIGTYWPGGFYEKVLQSNNYEKVVLGCYVDERYRALMDDVGFDTKLKDGDPIFPERETIDGLQDARIDMGDWSFTHQMLNLRADDSMRHFKEKDINHFTISADNATAIIPNFFGEKPLEVKLSKMYRVMTVDPATGEGSRTDDSAIVVCGHDRGSGLMFVLDTWNGRRRIDGVIDMVLHMAEKWQPHKIAPEDVSFQKTMKTYLIQEMRSRGISFAIDPVSPGSKSKVYRIIEAFQPFVKRGQVFFLKSQQNLIRELLSLQILAGNKRFAGKSPNLVDALAYQVQFWQKKENVIQEDEVRYEASFKEPLVPAYDLECFT